MRWRRAQSLKWLIEDGGEVVAGADVVEIETDKATMAVPAEDEGTLQIVVPEARRAKVGELIARIGVLVAAVVGGEAEPGSAKAAPAEEIPTEEEVASSVSRFEAPVDEATVGLATPVARRYAVVHGVALEKRPRDGPARANNQD
jgi:2-oxoglutarate dehydrogenase E2 component (dihydrolipoamide succinyltransferase)